MFTAGCFEVTEQYHFNADGSGKIVFDVGISHQVAAFAQDAGDDPWAEMRENLEKAKKEAEGDANVTSVTIEEKDIEDMRHFVVAIAVKDMTRASDAMKDMGGEDDMPGGAELSISRAPEYNTFAVWRTIKMGDGNDEPANPLMASMLAGKYYTVQVYGDTVLGEGGEAKEGYREWRKPLSEMMRSQSDWKISAGVQVRGDGTFVLLAIGTVLVLVVVAVVIWMKGGKKTA